MAILPIASVTKIIRSVGAERVGDDASKALAGVLEEYGQKISAEAVKLARHAGRKTVKDVDIRLALERQ